MSAWGFGLRGGRGAGLFWLLGLLLGVWLAWQPFYAKTYLSVSTDNLATHHALEWDTAAGSLRQHRAAPPDYPLLWVFSEHFNPAYEELRNHFRAYFELPLDAPLRGLRLELNSSRAELVLEQVCLHHRYRQHCWDGEQIRARFDLDSGYRLQDGALHFAGSRARLSYRGDLADLQQQWRSRHLPRQMLALASLLGFWLGLAWVARRYRQRRLWPRRLEPQHLLLGLGLGFGGWLAWFNPPLQVPDELYHLNQAYHLTHGGKTATACVEVPFNGVLVLLETHLRYRDGPRFDPAVREYLAHLPSHPQFALRAPFFGRHASLPYLPAALGLGLGQVLERPWLERVSLGRLGALLAYLACAWLALRWLPGGRWLLVLVALTPMALFQAASISVDSLTLGLSFVLTAAALRLGLAEPGRRWPWLLATLAASVGLALCKPPYLVLAGLAGLALLQPGGLRRYGWAAAGLALALALLAAGVWQSFVGNAAAPFASVTQAQAWQLLRHPLDYLGLVGHTLAVQGVDLARQMVGVFGWLEVPLPAWATWLHLALLLGFALTQPPTTPGLSVPRRGLILAVFAAGLLAVVTALYFIETPQIQSPIIDGLQGRYLLPLLLLPLLVLRVPRLALPERVHAVAATVYLAFALALMSVTISHHYA